MEKVKTYTLEELNSGQARYTILGLKSRNLSELAEQNVGLAINEYVLQNDKRHLLPIIHNGKIGLIDHNAHVVVQPQYDYISDCECDYDLLIVKKSCFVLERSREETLWGLIDTTGRTILSTKYRCILPSDSMNYFTVQDMSYRYGVIDKYENEIIPFGKFSPIGQMVKGFVRVGAQGGWGVSDLDGNLLFWGIEEIWDFKKEYDTIVVKKDHVRYAISYTSLEKFRQDMLSGNKSISIDDILRYESHLQGTFDSDDMTLTEFGLPKGNN